MNYELFYLVGASKEAALEKIKQEVAALVTSEGGVFEEKQVVEKRKMSYEIKKESRALEAESKQLETESYVKSRFLSDAFGRDSNMIKEYGIRLKEIQKRIREIVVILDQLQEEKIRINK